MNSSKRKKEDSKNDFLHLVCSNVNLDFKADGSAGPNPTGINDAMFIVLFQFLADRYSYNNGKSVSVCLDYLEPSAKGKFLEGISFVLQKCKSMIKDLDKIHASGLQDCQRNEEDCDFVTNKYEFRLWNPVLYVGSGDDLSLNGSYDEKSNTLYGIPVIRMQPGDDNVQETERLVLIYADTGKGFLMNMHKVPFLDKMSLMQDMIKYMNKRNIRLEGFIRDELLYTHQIFDLYFAYFTEVSSQAPPEGGNGIHRVLRSSSDLNITKNTNDIMDEIRDFYVFVSEDQQLVLQKICEKRQTTFLSGGGGVGKCLGSDVEILMADGTTKKSQDIRVGDVLVGIGDIPRIVRSVTTGESTLYKIKSTNDGDTSNFVCNGKHLLVLQKRKYLQGLGTLLAKDQHQENILKRSEEWVVSANDLWKQYLNHPECRDKDKSSVLKIPLTVTAFRSTVVKFPQEFDLWHKITEAFQSLVGCTDSITKEEIAWFIGVWYANGVSESDEICVSTDGRHPRFIDKFQSFGEKIGLSFSQHNKDRLSALVCDGLRSRIVTYFKELLDVGEIGSECSTIISSKMSIRLAFMAGIFDSNGHFNNKTGNSSIRIDISNINEHTMVRLCRNVGFNTTTCVIYDDNAMTDRTYLIATGGQEIVNMICFSILNKCVPTPHVDKYRKMTGYGITIEKLGIGEYYGFELGELPYYVSLSMYKQLRSKNLFDCETDLVRREKSGYFLLADLTVTHNSFLLKIIKRKLGYIGRSHVVTASTGRASVGIGGFTLHRFMGIGLGDKPVKQCIQQIYRKGKRENENLVLRNLRNTEVLIIDEVSMVNPDYFKKCDEVLRHVRGIKSRLFGGMQLVLCGDFFQLPPVYKDRKLREKQSKPIYCFELEEWQEGIQFEIELNKIYRQIGDPQFIQILNQVREGELNSENAEVLKSRMISQQPSTVTKSTVYQDATHIYPRREEVQNINCRRLRELDENIEHFKWSVEFNPAVKLTDYSKTNVMRFFHRNLPVEELQQYKKNARVLLRVNLDPERNLVNGSGGYIIDFDYPKDPKTNLPVGTKKYPLVKFDDWPQPVVIPPFQFYYNDTEKPPNEEKTTDDKGIQKKVKTYAWSACVYQIPLCLGWACTVHSAQGMTIKNMVLGASRMFDYGQMYVGLSRAETLNGLYLDKFDPKKIFSDKKVKQYYESLRTRLKDDYAKRKTKMLETKREIRSKSYINKETLGKNGLMVVKTAPGFVETIDFTKEQRTGSVRSSSHIHISSPEKEEKEEEEELSNYTGVKRKFHPPKQSFI